MNQNPNPQTNVGAACPKTITRTLTENNEVKEVKEKITISIDKTILKRLDDFCLKTKPVKSNRSPVIEKAISDFLEKEK